jgi:hypothetical protein
MLVEYDQFIATNLNKPDKRPVDTRVKRIAQRPPFLSNLNRADVNSSRTFASTETSGNLLGKAKKDQHSFAASKHAVNIVSRFPSNLHDETASRSLRSD